LGVPLPSIALAVICKNEEQNFPQLLASVRGCFDEIHVTDTGSTDGTLQLLERYRSANPADTPLFTHHFEWVRDFAAARNYAFSHPKTDYIAWLDLDDVLHNPEAFQDWRDTVMGTQDLWLATYHYGGMKDGVSPCKFMRERVIKNGLGFKWNFFVHEGILPQRADGKPCAIQYATSWSVVHRRTEADQAKDRSRNLQLFEGRGKLPPRMLYYYGKELFENGRPLEAFQQLVSAIAEPELEQHDRIMGIQFACMAAMQCSQFDRAIQLAHQGLQLAPQRAEFHVVIGDALVKQQKIAEAVPFFTAARSCQRNEEGSPFAGAIFSHADAYGHYPLHQLARCLFHTGRLTQAKETLLQAAAVGPSVETAQLMAELEKISQDMSVRDPQELQKTDEIVISCVPVPSCKNWDEESLKTRGLGGSETAVIHMARALHELTGRQVRVFNERDHVSEKDGVSYEPIAHMYAYFREKAPAVNIAWRHNFKLTKVPTYIWCHDLCFIGLEQGPNYTGVLALSEFHKRWLRNVYNVEEAKIHVTRNGIDPERYLLPAPQRHPHRVVFSSSPDRGLEETIRVMDLVVKEIPDAELHVFYGFNGMLAHNLVAEVAHLEALIAERPWVKFHGNVPQDKLTQAFQSAAVWLYPTKFLETFCITAIEALCAGVHPVVRKFGALPDTLRGANATILDTQDPASFAAATIQAMRAAESGASTAIDPQSVSWKAVAREWVELLKLNR
jgi:glycosyltransferase involved in cell wall biosynthesis